MFATKTTKTTGAKPAGGASYDLKLPYLPTADEYSHELVLAKKELAKLTTEAEKLEAEFNNAWAMASGANAAVPAELSRYAYAAIMTANGAREGLAKRAEWSEKAGALRGQLMAARKMVAEQHRKVEHLEGVARAEIKATIYEPFANELRRVATIRHLERFAKDYIAAAAAERLYKEATASRMFVASTYYDAPRLPFLPDPDVAKAYTRDLVENGILPVSDIPAELAAVWEL